MATLQNIRNKGVLLAVVIGVALLAFIIGDFLNSGSTLFQQAKQNVAVIDGEKVNIQTFQEMVEQINTVYKIEMGRSDFNENELSQIRSQVWESLINERLIEAEAKKIGLTVSKEELHESLLGSNIHPTIMQRPTFVDPQTGQFSRAQLLQFYNSVFSDDVPAEAREQLRDAKNYWLFWENAVKNAILQDKYFSLIGKSVGANSIEAKYNFEARKTSGDVNYIVMPYSNVSDSLIQISDAEYKKAYESKKEQLKQEPYRTIRYVQFDVVPLEEDFIEAQEWMDRVGEEFRTTTDVAGLVNTESDVTYDERHAYSRQTVPANLKDFAFSNGKDAIYGPVFQNNTHTMARIIETGIMESDSVNLRHIALMPTDELKADSLIKVLKGGADFGEIARNYSLADQSARLGGEVGWITRNALGQEIAEPAFSKGINEVFKVSSAQGIQIFQVKERTPARPKVKLAILERKISPSNLSYSKFYNEAKAFAGVVAADSKKFDEEAQKNGYVVRPSMELNKNTDNIDMIPQSRQVVRWAYENGQGAVSDVFDCDRNIYIVAKVNSINDKLYRSLEDVKPQLKSQIVKEKKSEILQNDLAEKLKVYPALDGLALAIGEEVKTATDVNFGTLQFGDAGTEPAVIGKISVLAANQVSKPIVGNSGVFVVEPLEKTENPIPFDAKAEAAQLDFRSTQALPYMIIQKLKDNYKVVDNRANFY